jgi:ELWxxDGT repeat protein
MNGGIFRQESRISFSGRFYRLSLLLIVLLVGVGMSTLVVLGADQNTPAMPYLIKDINLATEPSNPERLTDVNGTLFFMADDGVHGLELWKSDGTPGGTKLVKDIHPTGDANPNYLVNVNGILFFQASDGLHGSELWRSDGTENGTTMVVDLRPVSGSNPTYLTQIGDHVYFSAHGWQRWLRVVEERWNGDRHCPS